MRVELAPSWLTRLSCKVSLYGRKIHSSPSILDGESSIKAHLKEKELLYLLFNIKTFYTLLLEFFLIGSK